MLGRRSGTFGLDSPSHTDLATAISEEHIHDTDHKDGSVDSRQVVLVLRRQKGGTTPNSLHLLTQLGCMCRVDGTHGVQV